LLAAKQPQHWSTRVRLLAAKQPSKGVFLLAYFLHKGAFDSAYFLFFFILLTAGVFV
jgi:hypothetical protein